MGERVLPIVQALGEAAKAGAKKRERESQRTPRNKEAKAQGHEDGSKGGGGGVQLTESVAAAQRECEGGGY